MENIEKDTPRRKKNLPPELLKEIGKRIKKRRKAHGWKQQVLAEKANISVQYLSKIENGVGAFTVAVLKDIVEALDTSFDYIICGTVASSNTIPESTLKLLETYKENDFEFINRMLLFNREFIGMMENNKKK